MWSIARLRPLGCAVALLSLSSVVSLASATNATVKTLLGSFTVPQVFENSNLVRNINLERSYPRETTNLVVKNVGSKPESEYYYLFPSDLIPHVSGFEVKDKKDAKVGQFRVELAQYASPNPNSYFILSFPKPIPAGESITISVSYALVSLLQPLPAVIDQNDQQTVTYSFSAQLPSAYKSQLQKTKLTLPTSNPADFTRLAAKNADGGADPAHQGTSLTYGPYKGIGQSTGEKRTPVTVRYDFTKPLLHATRLERDVEVSHWGGNVAVEERYWLTNRAARLKNHFSRVTWQMSQFGQAGGPHTTAARDLRLTMGGGGVDAYYTDDIGNVSTSRFTKGKVESILDLKPRYPIFGGWNYNFKVGWNVELADFLRRVEGDGYILKVPFMEGPRTAEGIEYGKVTVRVILPEGAQNVQYTTQLPVSSSHSTVHKTFMDTIGRPTIVFEAKNAIEEWRSRGNIIITYDYPWTAGLRKPLTIAVAMFGVFFTAWIVGTLDVRIGKKKLA